MRRDKNFNERVYEAVKEIPVGKVVTYGQIASLLGMPGAARAVGNALHRNPYEGVVPCHRVVNAKGELARNFGFGGSEEQRVRLEAEGVSVIDERVELNKFQWKIVEEKTIDELDNGAIKSR